MARWKRSSQESRWKTLTCPRSAQALEIPWFRRDEDMVNFQAGKSLLTPWAAPTDFLNEHFLLYVHTLTYRPLPISQTCYSRSPCCGLTTHSQKSVLFNFFRLFWRTKTRFRKSVMGAWQNSHSTLTAIEPLDKILRHTVWRYRAWRSNTVSLLGMTYQWSLPRCFGFVDDANLLTASPSAERNCWALERVRDSCIPSYIQRAQRLGIWIALANI